jgi:hypothetical protein
MSRRGINPETPSKPDSKETSRWQAGMWKAGGAAVDGRLIAR